MEHRELLERLVKLAHQEEVVRQDPLGQLDQPAHPVSPVTLVPRAHKEIPAPLAQLANEVARATRAPLGPSEALANPASRDLEV
jgi:hypothetical protein